MKLILSSLLLLFSFSAVCEDSFSDFFKVAKKAYKEQKKIKNKEREEKEEEEEKKQLQLLKSRMTESEFLPYACVDCKNLLPLVKSVNNIMAGLKDNSEVGPREEIHELEAAYFITSHFDKKLKETKCNRYSLSNEKHVKDFKLENYDSYLVFSEVIPLRDLQSISMISDKSKRFFFRGKGEDADKVVEVYVVGVDQVKINYYDIRLTGKERNEAVARSFVEGLNEGMSKDTKTSGYWSDNEGVGFGLAVEHREFLPRKLKILDIDKTTKTSFVNINSEVKLTTNKVRAKLDFKDTESDQTYASLKVKGDGKTEVHIPTQFNVYATDLQFDGSTKLTSENSIGTNLRMNYGGIYIADIASEIDSEGDRFSISHERKVLDNGTVSFKYENNNSKNENTDKMGVWVRFKYKF